MSAKSEATHRMDADAARRAMERPGRPASYDEYASEGRGGAPVPIEQPVEDFYKDASAKAHEDYLRVVWMCSHMGEIVKPHLTVCWTCGETIFLAKYRGFVAPFDPVPREYGVAIVHPPRDREAFDVPVASGYIRKTDRNRDGAPCFAQHKCKGPK